MEEKKLFLYDDFEQIQPKRPAYSKQENPANNPESDKRYQVLIASYPLKQFLEADLSDEMYVGLESGTCDGCIGMCAVCSDCECEFKSQYQQD
ncbi:MAG TPA: hypothetical protein VJ343_00015 [archaeon]|nr:hypothetical protein [archaeon]